MSTTKQGRPPKPTPDAHLERLRRLAARIDGLEAELAELKAQRNAEILSAVAAGGAHRPIAAAAGIANQRVAQLVSQAKADGQ